MTGWIRSLGSYPIFMRLHVNTSYIQLKIMLMVSAYISKLGLLRHSQGLGGSCNASSSINRVTSYWLSFKVFQSLNDTVQISLNLV